MARSRPNRKPTFVWQALLIVLPVAVLAAVGVFSLRQDKILAQHDATERAQSIADDLLPKIWADLTAMKDPEELKHQAFEVDRVGQLVFPPSSARVLVPKPFNLGELGSEQAKLWRLTQTLETSPTEILSAIQAFHDFIGSNPPPPFAAAAHYGLGLLLARAGKYEDAAKMFERMLEKYPDAIGESGLPLAPLARWKLLELATLGAPNQFVSLDSFCYAAVYYEPTPLTPYFLGLLSTQGTSTNEIQKWQQVWEEHESSRRLYAAAHSQFPSVPFALNLREPDGSPAEAHSPINEIGSVVVPRFVWFSTSNAWRKGFSNVPRTDKFDINWEDRHWLAIRYDDASPSNHWYVCRFESEIGTEITALVDNTKQIPEYFGVGIELAGKKLTRSAPDLRVWHYQHYAGKPGGVRKDYLTPLAADSELATNILASAIKSEAGTEQLKVNVYLTSPTALFERESARAFWFGSLIAVSAGAALIGLIAASRAFTRQQQLSEMKSNFVSSVSHELRAPIASVRLMAESLERGKIQEPQKQNEYFRFIGQESRRLSALIENVLDFSRIEQGRKEYEFEPTDLMALTGQTVKLMETYASERQISIKLAPANLQPATCNLQLALDGRAIQQALVNLLDNAIKHSLKGETVMVGLESVTAQDASGTVQLWVEDHGEGIPPAEHEKIFERFYRLGTELRRETQGVGIGLSIVKHIVEAHGGRVLVRSAAGQGSRFTIELPLPADKGE